MILSVDNLLKGIFYQILYWFSNYCIYRIEAIGSVFPKNGVTVPRETYRNLSTYARKTEADIFYRANSRVCAEFNDDAAWNEFHKYSHSWHLLNFSVYLFWLQSDYYHLISDKIYKLQKDITKKVEEMKEPPAAANRTHQQPSQEHVTPGNEKIRYYDCI